MSSSTGRRANMQALRDATDSTEMARIFAEEAFLSPGSSEKKKVAVVGRGLRFEEDHYVVVRVDEEDVPSVKRALDDAVRPLVYLKNEELKMYVRRFFCDAFLGFSAEEHAAFLSDIDEDEQLPNSDAFVDSLGPERVALVDAKNVERYLSRFVEVDDGGDAGLMDKRRAAHVELEIKEAGVVTPRWTRRTATHRGSCDVHTPVINAPARKERILFLHGGANCACSPAVYRPLCSRLAAATGLIVAAPDFRLAPEHPYPAALEDACKALEWMTSGSMNCSSTDILLVGDSSGAALCLTLALKKKVKCVLAMSAWLDMSAESRAYQTRAWNGSRGDAVYNTGDFELERRETRRLQRLYWTEADPKDGGVHPFYAPAGELSNMLPEIYMVVGDGEIVRDDTTSFARRARRAGVTVRLDIWPRLWHVFQMYGEEKPLVEANVALRRAARWLRHMAGGTLTLPQDVTELCDLIPPDPQRPADDYFY